MPAGSSDCDSIIPISNGTSNSNHGNNIEMEDNAPFFYTSESVGEGHPGRCYSYYMLVFVVIVF